MGGISYYGGNGQNNYIGKYDINGNIAWQHDVGSVTTDDFYGVTETADHNIVVVGVQSGTMIIIKYTSDGVQLWAKKLSVLITTYAYSVIETSDGNLLITGSSTDIFTAYYAIVIKLDSDGNLLWNKNFDVGFDSSDDGYSCVETADHHYIIGIYGASINDFFYILSLDTAGNQLWSKQSSHSGVPYDLVATADSGVVVAGYICTTSGCDAMLSKLDKNGTILWSYTYGDSLFDRFYSATQTSDGGFAMAGDATDQIYILNGFVAKCDSSGQLQWSKTSDDVREFRSIDNSNDGGLIMSSTGGTGGLEFGLKKMDEDGNACCALNSYGSQNDGTTFSGVTVSSHNLAATLTDATMDETTFTPTTSITSCNEEGIEEVEKGNSLLIAPNPADQIAVCNYQLAENTTLKIFDVAGKEIFHSTFNIQR